jgi:hypothetical protein
MGIPQTINDRIAWFEQRIAVIKATPTAFGVTAPQATLLDADIKAARAAFDAAQKARTAAKDATVTQGAALGDMNRAGSIVVSAIRTFADNQPTTTARDAIYAAVSMTPPVPPSAQPAPETPFDVKADPNADGTVSVKWKASTNSGAVYLVYRKLAGNTAFSQVGLIAKKVFVDPTVPAGTTSCQYQVRAVRGTQMSNLTQPVSVQFGAAGAQGFQGNLGLAA